MSRAPAVVPLLAAALACLPAAAAAAAEAEDRPAPPERIFIDRVEVNVVNVEVFVTDRQGRRVGDLGREDFEVRVDSRPVEITNFYASASAPAPEAGDAGGIATVGLPATPGPAAETATAAETAAVAREQRLNLMVYVDHASMRPANRRRFLEHLRGFLTEGLDEHTWVMLVGYNGAVHVETPLTRNREAIAAGLDALGGYAAGAGPLSMDRVARVLQNSEPESLPTLVSSFMQQEEAKLRLSVRALAGSLALFAGLPGRKAVLHASDGLPMEVALAAQAIGGTLESPVAGLRNGERRLYGELVRAAQAHQIAFYPIDTRGPAGEDYSAAGYQAFSPPGPGDDPSLSNTFVGAAETLNRQEPLLEMAAATGGTAILNTYNFGRALEMVAIDFGSFYSLGFAAPHAGDGHRHAIDVRVKRPGLRVRHREGYVDKPLVERVGDRTLSFLQLEMESNPLGARISFGHPQRDGRRWIVPLLVRVPAEGVTLLPDGDARHGRLHFFVAVRDDRGRVSDLRHIPHPLTIPAGEAEPDAADLGLGINLEVRPGTWTVAVGVWDEIGGAESYLRETVEIVEPEREPGGRRGRRSR